MTKPGILALWNDCAKGDEVEYERWYQTEHLAERLSIPGILLGRRYEEVEARQGYFTYYETETPDVLISLPYRERLENPTPLTQQIMAGTLINMSRTICSVEERGGECRGGWAATIKLNETGHPGLHGIIDRLIAAPGVARAELWRAAEGMGAPLSKEEKIRGSDARITGCLLIDTLHDADARQAARTVQDKLGDAASEVGIYRLMCELAG